MFITYLTALLLITQAMTKSVKYDGHQVLKISPISMIESKLVLNMVTKYGLDIWHARHNDSSLDVQVYPDVIQAVTEELKILNISFSTWIHDIQKLIDQQHDHTKSHVFRRASSQPLMFSTYHNLPQIEAILAGWENDHGVGPSGQSILSENNIIGGTGDGRNIRVVKIYKPSTTSKKAIFVDGGIHAREWISPAFLLYLLNELKYNPTQSADIEDLVDSFDWYLVPVLNPDGYSFSHDSDRLWRKNRRVNSGSSCHGVDLNRNFGFQWNPDNGGSRDPCAQTYSGVGAFSEPESQAVKHFLEDSGIDFISYLTVHSYGQMWLYPWGYTSSLPSDVADLDTAAGVAITELRKRHNTRYVKGSSTNVLYAAAGGSDDYAKGSAGVKYSYTLELRDTGRYGFVLPENLIIPTCEETMDAFRVFAQHLKTAPET